MYEDDGLQVVQGHSELEVGKPPAGKEISSSLEAPDAKKHVSNHDSFLDQGSNNYGRKCGLRKRIFWSLCIGVGILIVAAAVGGGVGASMSNKNRDQTKTSNSATAITSTSTSSTSSFTSFPTSGILSIDCPALNSTKYNYTEASTSKTVTFTLYRGANYVSNPRAITGFNSTTVDGCMGKCVDYNTLSISETCVADGC